MASKQRKLITTLCLTFLGSLLGMRKATKSRAADLHELRLKIIFFVKLRFVVVVKVSLTHLQRKKVVHEFSHCFRSLFKLSHGHLMHYLIWNEGLIRPLH